MGKKIALYGLVSALYVVLSLVAAPLGFGPLQFRLGECLKPLVQRERGFVYSMTIGVFLVNLFSPYVNALELVLMPLVVFTGGLVAHRYKGVIPIVAYALWTSLGVAVTLHFSAGLPFVWVLLSVSASQVTLFVLGRFTIENIFRITKLQRS